MVRSNERTKLEAWNEEQGEIYNLLALPRDFFLSDPLLTNDCNIISDTKLLAIRNPA